MSEPPQLNWIVQPESDEGPLDCAQIKKLAHDFDLSESDLRTLSRDLAYPMSDRFLVRGVIDVLKGAEKGPVELEKLLNELRHAQKRIECAVALYSKIQVKFPAVQRGTGDPNIEIREELKDLLRKVAQVNKSLSRSSRKYSIYFSGHERRGRKPDDRRSAVLYRIFSMWDAAGRNVTISTRGTERGGPLIDFSNAVVRCLTDTPTWVSGSTIWSDMKVWIRYNRTNSSAAISDD